MVSSQTRSPRAELAGISAQRGFCLPGLADNGTAGNLLVNIDLYESIQRAQREHPAPLPGNGLCWKSLQEHPGGQQFPTSSHPDHISSHSPTWGGS